MNRFRRLSRQPVLWSLILAAVAIAAVPFAASAQEATKTFVMHSSPKLIASISFADGQGRTRSLRDFKGKLVVLNIWATWCVPCRTEMPALAEPVSHIHPTLPFVCMGRIGRNAFRKPT